MTVRDVAWAGRKRRGKWSEWREGGEKRGDEGRKNGVDEGARWRTEGSSEGDGWVDEWG